MAEDADACRAPPHVLQQVKAGERAAQQRVQFVPNADIEELPGLHVLCEFRRVEIQFEVAVAVIHPPGDGNVMQERNTFRGSAHACTMLGPGAARNVWESD